MQCAVSRETRALLAALTLAACAPGNAQPAPPRAPQALAAPRPVDRAAYVREADARELGPALRSALQHPDAETRLAATHALAQLRTPASAELLRLALLDQDAQVRSAAATGLAAARDPEAGRALAAALAIEREPTGRAALLEARAWAGTAPGRSLRAALDSPDPVEQAGACRALSRRLHRGRAPEPGTTLHLVQLASAGPADRRRACAETLAAFRHRPRTNPEPGITERIEEIATDADPSLRLSGTRALAHFGGASSIPLLEQHARGRSQPLAAAALRALHALERPVALLEALEQLSSELRADGRQLAGPRLAVLRLAHQLLAQHRDHPVLQDRATAAALRWPPVPGEPERRARARALADCAAAELADHVRKWPSRVEDCGSGLVARPLRDVAAARVLARVPGSEDQRAARLRALFASEEPGTRRAVLEAASQLPPDRALPLLLPGLQSDEPGLLAAAARSVAVLGPAVADHPRLRQSLETAAPRAAAHPEAALAWLGAVRALGLRALAPRVANLAKASPRGVWEVATGLLDAWKHPAPAAARSVLDPVSAERIPASAAGLHVQLDTTAGPIEIRLDTEHAPVAALRLLSQVRAGELDGSPVEPAVPGLLLRLGVQADAPGRHEGGPTRAQRGAILADDVGHDTLSGRLAIVLSREPAFDGRFTIVGQVTRGLEVAESLHELDRIEEARVSVAAAPGADQKRTPRRTGSE